MLRLVCTILSDKFGRKPIFLFSHWALIVVGVTNAFASNYYVFAVCRFLTGVCFIVSRSACVVPLIRGFVLPRDVL